MDKTRYWPFVVGMIVLCLIGFAGRNTAPEETSIPIPAWMWIGLVFFVLFAVVGFLVMLFGMRDPREYVPIQYGEDGEMYIYKVVHFDKQNGVVYSPNGAVWEVVDGEFQLWANEMPTEKNTNGIYGCKDRNDPILQQYLNAHEDARLTLVKADGQFVEHLTGLRAGHATIIAGEEGSKHEDWPDYPSWQ